MLPFSSQLKKHSINQRGDINSGQKSKIFSAVTATFSFGFFVSYSDKYFDAPLAQIDQNYYHHS